MKKLIFLFLLISKISFSQNGKLEFSITNSSGFISNRVISEGIAIIEKGIELKSLQIFYDGDINAFINRLKIDFGNDDTHHNGKISKLIFFRGIKKSDWTKNKFTLRISSLSNLNRHDITITCIDNKNNDLLEYGSETQLKIISYLEDKLRIKKDDLIKELD